MRFKLSIMPPLAFSSHRVCRRRCPFKIFTTLIRPQAEYRAMYYRQHCHVSSSAQRGQPEVTQSFEFSNPKVPQETLLHTIDLLKQSLSGMVDCRGFAFNVSNDFGFCRKESTRSKRVLNFHDALSETFIIHSSMYSPGSKSTPSVFNGFPYGVDRERIVMDSFPALNSAWLARPH